MSTPHVWRRPRGDEPPGEAGVCASCGLYASEGGTSCASPLTDEAIDSAIGELSRSPEQLTREKLDEAIDVIEVLQISRDSWRRRAHRHGCIDDGDPDCG